MSLTCMLWGHEDTVRREPARVYLECFECGRTTGGWRLAPDVAQPRSAQPHWLHGLWQAFRAWLTPTRSALALRFNSR